MSYWQSQLSNRLSRRRALSITAAGVASAAFLAACGGGSDDKPSSSGAQKGESLLAKGTFEHAGQRHSSSNGCCNPLPMSMGSGGERAYPAS